MPRPRIYDEASAARFAARCAEKAVRGELDPQKLYAINQTIQTALNAWKQERDTERRAELEEEERWLKRELNAAMEPGASIGMRLQVQKMLLRTRSIHSVLTS